MVRGKTLLRTYNANIVYSNLIPENKGGEALMVVLKVWQEKKPSMECSMTYLRTGGQYADLPLSCFAIPSVYDGNNMTVKLEAVGYTPSSPSSKTKRKGSWVSRGNSKSKSLFPAPQVCLTNTRPQNDLALRAALSI